MVSREGPEVEGWRGRSGACCVLDVKGPSIARQLGTPPCSSSGAQKGCARRGCIQPGGQFLGCEGPPLWFHVAWTTSCGAEPDGCQHSIFPPPSPSLLSKLLLAPAFAIRPPLLIPQFASLALYLWLSFMLCFQYFNFVCRSQQNAMSKFALLH